MPRSIYGLDCDIKVIRIDSIPIWTTDIDYPSVDEDFLTAPVSPYGHMTCSQSIDAAEFGKLAPVEGGY